MRFERDNVEIKHISKSVLSQLSSGLSFIRSTVVKAQEQPQTNSKTTASLQWATLSIFICLTLASLLNIPNTHAHTHKYASSITYPPVFAHGHLSSMHTTSFPASPSIPLLKQASFAVSFLTFFPLLSLSFPNSDRLCRFWQFAVLP